MEGNLLLLNKFLEVQKMRKIDALKKLAVKLGLASAVSDVTGTTNSEVIDFMATKIKNVMEVPQEMLIKSSTAESTKVFKITVVDNGTISATEVVSENA